MAATDTITVYRGEDVLLPFELSPVEDIDGWTLLLSVKDGTAVLFTKDGTVDDAEYGAFSFLLDAADTQALEARAYRYDVWRTDNGSERVLAIGAFTVAEIVREVST